MRTQAADFKDQLFNLYSGHIEMIEAIANAAQSPTAEPDYGNLADAVSTFEEAGEPEAEVPVFTEYPQNSIFPKREEPKEEEEEEEMESPADVPIAQEEASPVKEEIESEPQHQEISEEEDDFFTKGDEEPEKIYSFDTEAVSTTAKETDYYQYLREFTENNHNDK